MVWWDERTTRGDWSKRTTQEEGGRRDTKTKWAVVDLDCAYTRRAVLHAFKQAKAAKAKGGSNSRNWDWVWEIEDVSPKEGQEEDDGSSGDKSGRREGTPDVYWGEYERIDWDRVGAGEVAANCYCIRKGLIRKAQLALGLSKWKTKYPSVEIASSVPETHVFELYDIEYFEEVLIADVPELRDIKPGDVWILKPNITNQALGVRVFDDLDTLKSILASDEAWNLREWVVQRYIARPLLVDRKKFHVRVYALAVGAMKVYVYDDMLALFAAETYDSSLRNLSNSKSHLTNTCRAGIAEAEPRGEPKVLETSVVRLLDELPAISGGVATSEKVGAAKERIKLLVGQCFEAVSSELSFMPMPNCFELFGFDFLIDEEWQGWLLEANAEPDFVQTGQRLQAVITDMISGVYHEAIVPLLSGAGGVTGGGAGEEKEKEEAASCSESKWCKVFEKHVSGSDSMNFQIV